MDKSWLAILPPILTIGVAIWSKKILPSLLLGLIVGSYLLNFTFIGGIETAVAHIVKILSDEENLQVLIFLYLFSGLITIIRRAGGIDAFSELISRRVKSDRGVFYTLWALIPFTFIDCAFRIVGTGSILRTLVQKNKINEERLAFMLNNTASPVIELVPIATTFVGFNIANIGQALKAAGVVKLHPYSVLLRAIPYEFFSLVVLVITFGSIYLKTKKQSSAVSHKSLPKSSSGAMDMDMPEMKPEINPRILNLVIPMLSIIFLSIFFFWYFGKIKTEANSSLSSIISATDPNKAMLVALFISIIITGTVYYSQKYSLEKMSKDIITGGNELMTIIVILVVAWALGAVAQELNLSQFLQQQVGASIPIWSIPVTLFLVSSAVTYFIGEGWAAASLIMPFAVAFAVSSNIGVPICVAAVITGGTFGDTTSPIAGMTNMASNVSRADHMKYIKYMSPYNFAALGIAALLFLIFGFVSQS